jgi:glutathione S-transferase
MILYDNASSSNALKVRFLLAELGITYERRHVAFSFPRDPAYLAINPLGGVPAIDHDGFVLAESNTILRYLAQLAGRDDLYPAEARDRARVDEFLDRFALTIRPALFRIEAVALGFRLGAGMTGECTEPERIPAVVAEVAPQLALFESLVTEQGAALGRFTIADCSCMPALWRTIRSGVDMSPYPRLRALRDALAARPAFLAAGPVI